jgi:hypothetical protein
MLNDTPLSVRNRRGSPNRMAASATVLIAVREFSVPSMAQDTIIREWSSSTW